MYTTTMMLPVLQLWARISCPDSANLPVSSDIWYAPWNLSRMFCQSETNYSGLTEFGASYLNSSWNIFKLYIFKELYFVVYIMCAYFAAQRNSSLSRSASSFGRMTLLTWTIQSIVAIPVRLLWSHKFQHKVCLCVTMETLFDVQQFVWRISNLSGENLNNENIW